MVACPTCGTENPARSRFCNGCGGSLTTPQASLPAATHLNEARMTFAELGAAPVLAETDRLLAHLHVGGYRGVVSMTDP